MAWHEEEAVRSRLRPVPTGMPASLNKVDAAKLPTRSLPASRLLYAAVSDTLRIVAKQLCQAPGVST